VVTLYLLPRLNVQLRPKLFAELRPGSRVVSHAFDMGDWLADSTQSLDGRMVYYWLMPAKVDGTWTLSAPAGASNRSYEMTIKQNYQRFTGTAATGGRTASIEGGRIVGDSVMFTLIDTAGGTQQRMQFAGRLTNGALSLAVSGAGAGSGQWRGARRARP
jgi:hypothetical protein